MSRAGAVSNPSLLTVPLQRAANAFPQSDSRLEADLPARAADVEGAALPEEVYTPSVQRRRDPERRADELAGPRRQPHRPDREPSTGTRNSSDFGRDGHQL